MVLFEETGRKKYGFTRATDAHFLAALLERASAEKALDLPGLDAEEVELELIVRLLESDWALALLDKNLQGDRRDAIAGIRKRILPTYLRRP